MSTRLPVEKIKSDKWLRDGAKYVCKKCKTKFFTKDEAEKCFDAHKPG